MTEIRSYRRVFDLERRIYRIDRLRLNPSGVPLLGIAYFVVLVAASLAITRVPVLSRPVGAIPWYLRAVVLPGLAAALLGVIRVEGRPFHVAAQALLRFGLGPRWLAGLQPSGAPGRRWYPDELVLLPDGSDAHVRQLLYTGPGAALVAVGFTCSTRAAGLTGCLIHRRRPRRRISLRERPDAPRRDEAAVVELDRGASLRCYRGEL